MQASHSHVLARPPSISREGAARPEREGRARSQSRLSVWEKEGWFDRGSVRMVGSIGGVFEWLFKKTANN